MFGLVAVGLLVASSAQAQGRGHDRHREIERRAEVRHGDRFVGDRRGDAYDDYRDGRRVPPGLAKKPGYMPPGQYKKRYGTYEGANVLSEIMQRRGYRVSRVVPSGRSRYVYYRLHDDTERRAIVGVGADRLTFNDVPPSILQSVLAQLY